MSETIRVWAVPGALVEHPMHRTRFIGYETIHGAGPADHVVPKGLRYRIKPEGEEVVKNLHVRRALAKGSLTDKAPSAPTTTITADEPVAAAESEG